MRAGAALALGLLLAGGASAQRFGDGVPRWTHGPRTVDVRHVALDLAVDVPGQRIAGTATLTVTPLGRSRAVTLDAVDFEIAGVRVGAATAETAATAFDYADRKHLTLTLPEGDGPFDVVVTYATTPMSGLHFVPADPDYPGLGPEMWSQGEPEDSRYWFPVPDYPDDRFTSEVRVAVPEALQAVSNGALVDEHVEGGVRHVHYRMAQEHPAYLVSVVAAPLERVPLEGPAPLAVWAPPGRADDARATFEPTGAMLEYLAAFTGVPYPFERYDQVLVSDFMWSGMENTTTSTLTRTALLGPVLRAESDSEGLIVHELAHQWFGNLVTCAGWQHLWLNEGFASYIEVLWLERSRSRGAGDLERLTSAEWYLGAAATRALDEDRFENPDDLFDAHSYAKGAAVLHMLRVELGDEVFTRAVRRYLHDHRNTFVEADDLRRAMEAESGRDLRGFFGQWVERPGHPSVEATWRWDARSHAVVLTLTQGRTAPFVLHLPVLLGGPNGVTESVVTLDARQAVRRIPADAPPRFVVVDPRGDVLMDLTEEPTVEELLARLTDATEPVTRIRAAEALDDAELTRAQREPAVKGLLQLAASPNELELVRTRALTALGSLGGAAAVAGLRGLTRDPVAAVRAGAWSALGEALDDPLPDDAAELPAPEAARVLFRAAMRSDTSPSVRAAAVGAASRIASRKEHVAICREALAVPPTEGDDAVALAGVACLEAAGTDRAFRAAVEATRSGVPHAVRAAALGTVSRLGHARASRRDAAREAIEAALRSPWRTVLQAAVDGAAVLGDARMAPALATVAARAPASRELELALRRARQALGVAPASPPPKPPSVEDRLRALEERVDHLEQEH